MARESWLHTHTYCTPMYIKTNTALNLREREKGEVNTQTPTTNVYPANAELHRKLHYPCRRRKKKMESREERVRLLVPKIAERQETNDRRVEKIKREGEKSGNGEWK